MTPQELKNSILQLAIQGKLVEQRPEEGTAEELFSKIQKEKQKLITEKKIKKEKPLPEITDDEKPFDIPENWMWVRFGNIVNVVSARRVHQSDWKTNGVPFYRAREIARLADDGVVDNELFISEELYENFSRSGIPKPGDLLVTAVGTLGKCYVVQDEDRFYYKDASVICLENYARLFPKYLQLIMQSEMLMKQIRSNSSGTTVATLTMVRMVQYLLPLPPLAEQKRIVSKIEEILPYIDCYEQAWSKLEQFNSRFPDDMKKSLLQYAIQGKLVEQRPEEGTAEELFTQIQKEKQRLIAEKKIKKEKSLPEITDDEKPFDIPESWKWVRIGEIFGLQAGKNITSSNIYEEKSEQNPYLCFGGNGVRGFVANYNREGHFALIGRQGALCGNVNLAEGRFYATEHAVVVDHYNMTNVLWCGWFLKALNLNQYATATAQPGLAVANIVKVLIPLPPLEEQKRIVEKLEQLLPLCERLK